MNAKQLIDEYRKLHDGTQFLGYTLKSYKAQVFAAINELGAKTVLDWGCGRAEAWSDWHAALKLHEVYKYDPGVKSFRYPPGEGAKFDLVIACDVLEHLLQSDAEVAINTLFSHARKGVWASICCRAAKKAFPDGTNMHVTLKPYAWWLERFEAAADGRKFWLVETP